MNNNFLLLKNKSILFAEDDFISRNHIAEILIMLFDKVHVASDGVEAYDIYQDEEPDIILTDIIMPKRDGLRLIEKIREHDYKIPIVLMSSFVEQEFLLDAANNSVDGYLVKPASLEKLNATLCKALQRTEEQMGLFALNETYFYNFARKELYNNGIAIPLGVKEHLLLMLLLNNRDRTVTKEEIEHEIWPLEEISNSAIKKLILRIRQKIDPDLIISVRGVGYRLQTRKTSRAS